MKPVGMLVARLALASAAALQVLKPGGVTTLIHCEELAVGFAAHEAAAIVCGRMQGVWLDR